MFKIIDSKNAFKPVKSRFKTQAQALDWAKKNLPEDCQSFGNSGYYDRYFIIKY